MIKKNITYVLIGFTIIIVLAISPKTRNICTEILSNLRTNDYRTNYISPDYFDKIKLKLYEEGNREINLKQLGYLKVNKDDKERHYEYKINELYKLKSDADYNFKTPQESNILNDLKNIDSTIIGSQSIEFNLNIDAINNFMKTYKSNNVFPESLNGKNFRIDFYKKIYIHMDNSSEFNFPGSKRFNLTIERIPEINVPNGVDTNKVKYAVISLPFLPDDLKSQISGTVDLKNLLEIPESAERKKLDYTSINKNKGVTVSYYLKDANISNKNKEKREAFVQIAWIEDDIIYQMEGIGISENQLIKIAESMK
ncbi:hypothetical protein [Calorimonas adulescens]|nr:hypothetical protein [Calorimonas adulescens]